MAKQQREVKLAYVRSTPGTHVFGTMEQGVICKQVYLPKEAMPTPPKEITLTVSWEAA